MDAASQPRLAGAPSNAPPGTARWQVRLLGGLSLSDAPQGGRQHILRLPSRAVGALLARLALWPERTHAREELVELLWPGVELTVGRNRLRQALSTLKALLETPGQAPVLVADRLGVRVAPGALACDARTFEAHARAGQPAQALACYLGELLPGFYDGWIDDERKRLAALAERLGDGAVPGTLGPGGLPSDARNARVFSAAPPAFAPADGDLGRATLPAYLTRFFGADAQAARLRGQVLAHRLVTLTGPGGAGKTRLAVELAQALHTTPDFTQQPSPGQPLQRAFDLVVFVPLVACAEPAAMLDAMLAALRVRAGSGDATERLAQAFGGRHALLVLDNMEHLLPQGALLVARLAAALPRLHLLVTSRRLLELDGEREIRVAPLALPAKDASLDDTAASPAVALFVDRARAARADFHLGPRNALVLAELVRALQGMPLAIELAATRVRSFTPAEMLARLRGGTAGAIGEGRTPGLDLLARSGPRAGSDPRHASMHRVIAWSWEQLTPPLAQLLAALTVFDGGFTTAAAQAVSGQQDAATLIDALLSHSLLSAREEADGGLRFTLYEPVREFAAAQLDDATAARLRARHRAWWPQWAAGFGATPPLAAVRAERPNLEAALASALADGAPDDALRAVLALRSALNDVSLPASALARVALALERSTDKALKSRAHTLLGVLSFDAGERDAALRHVEQGLALAPPAGAVRARALHALASVRWRSVRDPAPLAALLDEATALSGGGPDGCAEGDDNDALDNIETQASVTALRAYMANVHDRDYARGEALHRQAVALWQRLGNAHAINGGIYNLAICAFNARRWPEALQRTQTVCDTARAQQDWQQLSAALNVQGNTLAALRDWPRALQAYRECVEVAWAWAEHHALAYGLWNAPRALAHLRRPLDAARLMGFIAGHWSTHFGAHGADDRFDLRRLRRLAAVQCGRAASAKAFDDGATLSLAQAVSVLRS